jgi:hypothetical protein
MLAIDEELNRVMMWITSTQVVVDVIDLDRLDHDACDNNLALIGIGGQW